jgi:hypothetical protein
MARYLHKNRFIVVEETAELLTATIVFPQAAVSAAGHGSQVILAERHFMASGTDIDALRRAGI